LDSVHRMEPFRLIHVGYIPHWDPPAGLTSLPLKNPLRVQWKVRCNCSSAIDLQSL
jgi:hypothetical protein